MHNLFILLCCVALLGACKSTPETDDAPPAETSAAEAPAEDSPAQAASLDGKSFAVTITEADGKSSQDTLTFADGTFDSTACQEWGFSAAAYELTGSAFTSTATSEKEGSMTWTGTVDGDKISGKYTWTKEGQDAIVATFEGSVAP